MDLCWQSYVSAFEEKEWNCVSPAWLGSENKKFWGLVWISFFLLWMSLRKGGGSVCCNNYHVEVPWLQRLLTGDLNLEMNYGSLRSFVNNGECLPTARCWKRQVPTTPEKLYLSAGPRGRRRSSHVCKASEGGWTRKLQGEPNKLFSIEGSWKPANLAKSDTEELLSRG